ncbi:hypothetical protein F511_36487 [Dorcoceras hygrometricum]|uniref:Uncharacterized protein n=1 Tax=Dorcoceras hygrometricum TaxID=472368 RepID=A0A2Z7C0P0_9LAMI|nr:hypothetical protein F511_36487 [Dorcoceras hygrometricum]
MKSRKQLLNFGDPKSVVPPSRVYNVDCGRLRQSGPRPETGFLRQPALEGLTRSARTDSPRQDWHEQFSGEATAAAASGSGGVIERREAALIALGKSHSQKSSSHAQHIEPSITDSACKNQLVVVSIQYGPFNPYIPIRSTTIGKSRVAIDPIAMRTSWRSNSDIASVTSIGYPRMSASGESSTTMHRLLHASGSHPIPPPDDPKSETPSSGCTRSPDEISTNGFSSSNWPETIFRRRSAAAVAAAAAA